MQYIVDDTLRLLFLKEQASTLYSTVHTTVWNMLYCTVYTIVYLILYILYSVQQQCIRGGKESEAQYWANLASHFDFVIV